MSAVEVIAVMAYGLLLYALGNIQGREAGRWAEQSRQLQTRIDAERESAAAVSGEQAQPDGETPR